MRRKDKVYSVYGLIDPRTSICFYIGCGAKERIVMTNQVSSMSPRQRKDFRINKLAGLGLSAKIKILKQGLSKQESFAWEKYYIAKYGRRDLGEGFLLNETDGGAGTLNASRRIKEKMSLAKKGILKTREHKLAIAKALRGIPKSPEHCRAISAGLRGKKHSIARRFKNAEAQRGRIRDEFGKFVKKGVQYC